MKEAYRFWLALHRDFPRVERLGIGQRIEHSFLDLLGLTFSASYQPIEPKIIYLGQAISKLDILRFFIQLAWEDQLLPTKKYSVLLTQLGEIGRQLGGWKRGLQTKTPTK